MCKPRIGEYPSPGDNLTLFVKPISQSIKSIKQSIKVQVLEDPVFAYFTLSVLLIFTF